MTDTSVPRAAAPAADRSARMLLPTTVVGSYSVPEWLERLKTEYYQRRISAAVVPSSTGPTLEGMISSRNSRSLARAA